MRGYRSGPFCRPEGQGLRTETQCLDRHAVVPWRGARGSPSEKGLPLACRGCKDVPRCGTYTRDNRTHVKSQAGVVRAVQEWLSEAQPGLQIYHTVENFTWQYLTEYGMDYDLVLTTTRNPSWFVVKPLPGQPLQDRS